MTLLEEIQSKCSAEQIAERNFHIIAATVNVGRTIPNGREIGNGTILATLGLAKGNTVLDLIRADPAYKYVTPLLDQGRLIASDPLVASAVAGLQAAGVLTQSEADKLAALGHDPSTVTWEQCQAAFVEAGM